MLLFLFMMAHRPEYAPQSAGVKNHSDSDRLVFKTIIQPRTFLSRRVVIGSGGVHLCCYCCCSGADLVYVASLFGHLLCIVIVCCAFAWLR